MPLQFIFGPSGSGKSHYLYQHIIRESMRHRERNYVVLVPEQFTMQTQKDLVTMHPNKGIMNIDVQSFVRLAYRVFEETGGAALPVLDDEGKNLVLRKVAAACGDELKILKGNIKKLGYISEVKSVISEFMQYGIGEDELDRVLSAAGKDTGAYYKLQDIRTIYRGFEAYLKEKYITKEELLDVLTRMVPQSAMLRNSTVVLDGFTGFTPVQDRLLSALLEHCRDVIMTVTIDKREDPYVYTHPYQLFALSKQMTASLVKIARGAGAEVKEPVRLFDEPVRRFEHNEPLAFLEHNLFRYGTSTYEKDQDSIHIHAARNPREEAQAAAARVRKLVRKEGYRYRQIGVIAGDMDVYGDNLEQAFAAYDIPVFMDHKRSILLNPFVEYIRSLLNMAVQNFTYESVFRFLRTQWSGFSRDEVDEMDNYVTGIGIRGYKRWQQQWIRRLKGMPEEELGRLNHNRVLFVEKIDDLVYVLKHRKKTVRDITLALYQFLVKEDLQRRLKVQEQEFQEQGELALAREYAQVYRIVMELFDKFVELLGDEPVSLKEYSDLMDAGLNEAKVGVIPPSVDQVVVGDVKRTRLKDIKALIFVGANDTFLPGALGRTGLLTERDRERFAREKLSLSPGGKEQAYIQKFYLYTNLTKPSQVLDIYYSKVSSEGKTIRPAYLIQELEKLYPGLAVEDEEGRELWEKELTGDIGIPYLIGGLKESGLTLPDAWCELYAMYKRMPQWQHKLDNLLDAAYNRYTPDKLDEAVAQALYGDTFENSVTRLERYSACAYAHFLTYGLKLRERQEYEFEAVDMGNICHNALELYSRKVESEGTGWVDLPDDKRRTYILESVDEAVTDYGNSVLYSTARNEYMISRIKSMMERTVWALTEQLSAGDFRPEAYELRFGNGKIDRIDTCADEENVYVKVLDYKTGSKAFDVTALYHGLELQLMVYMNAAVDIERQKNPGKEIVPAGVFYYRVCDPLVDKQPDEEALDEAVLRELKLDGLISLEGDVLSHLDRHMSGESVSVPVRYNKDGSLAKGSKVLPAEDFRVLMEYADHLAVRLHGEITSGKADVSPYRRGQDSGCDYCAYRNICGFDTRIPGYAYRDIAAMSKEEAVAAMKGELR